jgi:glycopeptide antibiotics resistance protein
LPGFDFIFILGTPLTLVLALAVAVVIGIRLRLELGRFAALIIFTVYLVGVANFVLLPLRSEPALSEAMGPIELDRLLNVKPFFLPGADAMTDEQLYLNILLTVPFGFGLPFVAPISLKAVIVAGVLFSLGIEIAQAVADVTGLALPTWSVDINDVILNSLGVVIGVALFAAAHTVYRAKLGRLPAAHLGPWRHFHETLVAGRSASSTKHKTVRIEQRLSGHQSDG